MLNELNREQIKMMGKVLKKADHNPIPLEQGTYLFGIQQEYNPFAKVMENVID